MAETSVSYGARVQSRTLQPVANQEGRLRWLVGSTSLRDENELRVVEYDPDQDSITSICSWGHPEEVWDVTCHASCSDRLVTVHSKEGAYGATLWQATPGANTLTSLSTLKHNGIVRRALWHQHNPQRLITLEESALHCWQLADAAVQHVASQSPGELQQLWSGALHPKDPKLAAAAAGNGVQVWDVQNVAKVGEQACAHRVPVRDVDWAPNNPHRLVTGGDDGKLRFWDTRMLAGPEPLQELSGHSHWVWKARFSPFHDQLLLSGSTDNSVVLWYLPVLAKAKEPQPGRAMTSVTNSRRQEGDGRVQTYDEHEDSVYGLAWSPHDPWVFASMSYDGRLVVNKVPKSTKYKILI